MTNMTIERLAAEGLARNESHRQGLEELFTRLKTIDSEVATLAVDVLGSEANAASWMFSPLKALGNCLPISAIADGKRDRVITVLQRIAHGVYS